MIYNINRLHVAAAVALLGFVHAPMDEAVRLGVKRRVKAPMETDADNRPCDIIEETDRFGRWIVHLRYHPHGQGHDMIRVETNDELSKFGDGYHSGIETKEPSPARSPAPVTPPESSIETGKPGISLDEFVGIVEQLELENKDRDSAHPHAVKRRRLWNADDPDFVVTTRVQPSYPIVKETFTSDVDTVDAHGIRTSPSASPLPSPAASVASFFEDAVDEAEPEVLADDEEKFIARMKALSNAKANDAEFRLNALAGEWLQFYQENLLEVADAPSPLQQSQLASPSHVETELSLTPDETKFITESKLLPDGVTIVSKGKGWARKSALRITELRYWWRWVRENIAQYVASKVDGFLRDVTHFEKHGLAWLVADESSSMHEHMKQHMLDIHDAVVEKKFMFDAQCENCHVEKFILEPILVRLFEATNEPNCEHVSIDVLRDTSNPFWNGKLCVRFNTWLHTLLSHSDVAVHLKGMADLYEVAVQGQSRNGGRPGRVARKAALNTIRRVARKGRVASKAATLLRS